MRSLLKRVKRKLIKLRDVSASFGLRVALVTEILPFLIPKGLKHRFLLKKHAFLSRFIAKRYASVIEGFHNARGPTAYDLKINPVREDKRIWILWWQGEAQMPPLVRACYDSIRRQAPSELVTLVTKNNASHFIHLPQYIFDKVDDGAISLTHLSDIIRAALLFQRGGLWIDATVFASKPITDSILSAGFFTLKPPYFVDTISYGRWTTFLMGARQGSPVFQLLQSLFFSYWQKENILIDYFLIDYMLAVAYDNSEKVRLLIDAGGVDGRDIFDLASSLDKEFDDNLFTQMTNRTTFHKLNWKLPWRPTTREGAETIYAHVVRLSEA
jgi:hypothetical protein